MAKRFGIVPGDLCYRERDNHMGIIVIAQSPEWDKESNRSTGWRFEILIDGILDVTDRFASEYKMVHFCV